MYLWQNVSAFGITMYLWRNPSAFGITMYLLEKRKCLQGVRMISSYLRNSIAIRAYKRSIWYHFSVIIESRNLLLNRHRFRRYYPMNRYS
jgi:hypothetical protein